MDLRDRDFWVFDMDGTLTVPAHDFARFKAQHGLPKDRDLLGAALALPEARRLAVLRAIEEWEDAIARAALPQADAVVLLEALVERGARLGVLTRNSREGALVTLEAAGLLRFFPDEDAILGRDCAPPKPAPDGVQQILAGWGASAESAVMVGDWVFDAMAGRSAGAATVIVERHGPSPAEWLPWADVCVERLDQLLA